MVDTFTYTANILNNICYVRYMHIAINHLRNIYLIRSGVWRFDKTVIVSSKQIHAIQ